MRHMSKPETQTQTQTRIQAYISYLRENSSEILDIVYDVIRYMKLIAGLSDAIKTMASAYKKIIEIAGKQGDLKLVNIPGGASLDADRIIESAIKIINASEVVVKFMESFKICIPDTTPEDVKINEVKRSMEKILDLALAISTVRNEVKALQTLTDVLTDYGDLYELSYSIRYRAREDLKILMEELENGVADFAREALTPLADIILTKR